MHTGSRRNLSADELEIIDHAVRLTRDNGPRVFNLVFNYGGRAEVVHAARALAAQGASLETVTKAMLASDLYSPDLPDVDLVIRFGGDNRMSNFLLWQTSRAWFYSVRHYWPDVDRNDIERALEYYDGAMNRGR